MEAAATRTLKQGRHFREVLAGDAQISKHITAGALAELFEPGNYLGEAEAIVDRVVENYGKPDAGQKRGAKR